MELFQENKNLLFQATVDLINDMVENSRGLTEKEVRNCLKKIISEECAQEVKGSLEDKIDVLLFGKIDEDENGWTSSLFEKNEDNYYEPKIKMEIPYIPTKLERYVLEELTKDSIAKNLLSDKILGKLCEDIEVEAEQGKYLYKNQKEIKRQSEKQQNLKHVLEALMKAMMEEKMIMYDNQTKRGLLEGKIGTPYKFVYSSRLNRIQLIIKPKDENRGVMVNIEGLKNIQILEQRAEESLESWFEEQKREIVLKIIKKGNHTREKSVNVVERCFSLFSHLDKEAIYNKEEDTHIITIKYYRFDQEDIVRDILSMGSDVVVLEPKELREKIVASII